FEFPPHSGANVSSDNGGPMSIIFSLSVTSVGGFFTYAEALTITAFSALGDPVLSMVSKFSNNEALSGVVGSSPNEFINLSFSSGISKITITGDPGGTSFTLDDLTIHTIPTVSDSGSSIFLLFITALLLLGFRWKRLSKSSGSLS